MSTHKPPHLARKVLEWYCDQARIEDLLGDLDELFYLNLKNISPFQAKLHYWKQVFSLMTSYAIQKRKKDARLSPYVSSVISIDLFKNYLKIAIRNLYQHKYFTILNTFGLAIGMSVSLLLISMFSYTSTYDSFHKEKENIYSIASTRTEGIEQIDLDSSPILLGEKIKEEFPAVREVIRIHASLNDEVKSEKENIPLNGYYVDSNFLSVFTFELLHGNPQSALSKPNSLVLTESAARKIFGTSDARGKIVEFETLGTFEVTGILKEPPKNSHLEFEMLASYQSRPINLTALSTQWTDYMDQYVYVLLHDGAGSNQLQRYLDSIAKQTYTQTDVKVNFVLQPLTKIAFSDRYNAIGPKWELSGFIVFGIIALLILLPACFNYANISIARALKRSKEIALRKTMGSAKSQIFFQFITETVLITLISLVGALLIFIFIRSEFQSMMVEVSSLDLNLTWKMVALFIFFALSTGFAAGAFPALYFGRLNPIQALRDKTSPTMLSGMRIRKGLTIIQFALSFCFIISLIASSRQYQSIRSFDFGFKKENMLDVALQGVDPVIFKSEFSKISSIESVSFSSGLLSISKSLTWAKTPEKDSIEVNQMFVDNTYFNNLDLHFLAGNSFPNDYGLEERYIIVNESFLKSLKIATPADAIGKTYWIDGKELLILGVLRNFHFAPPHIPINNFIFRSNSTAYTYANLKINTHNVHLAYSSMEKSWKVIAPQLPFKARFFEEELNDSTFNYKTFLKIAGFLGMLALSISLLGLLGMVVYTTEIKTKEISIRKVLGAGTTGLTLMLSKDYLNLIIIAIVLAIPISFFVFENVYNQIPDIQITLSIWDILLSSFTLMLLGLITITSHTVKTARANPAETLKAE